ncbi:MAG: ECF-type sigma factor [Acidobacteriota bacterium]
MIGNGESGGDRGFSGIPRAGDPRPITALLRAIESGDSIALDTLFGLVYEELRRIAQRQLAASGLRRTLNTTAVVHEAFLKLSHGLPWSLRDRFHFFATSSRAMRMVIVDHARSRSRQKRGGGRLDFPLEDNVAALDQQSDNIVALNDALGRLEASDPDLARIVEWRFFGGLSIEEIARTLEVSERTVKRHWRTARAFLYAELAREGFGG